MNTLPPHDKSGSSLGGRAWKSCPQCQGAGEVLELVLRGQDKLIECPVCQDHFKELDEAIAGERDDCVIAVCPYCRAGDTLIPTGRTDDEGKFIPDGKHKHIGNMDTGVGVTGWEHECLADKIRARNKDKTGIKED